ncbi:MAG TPA: hypothetical protein VEV20_10605 [Burkholderiales bacterium]|nr:hypothetical protein [Burkholderiales bacterium]
MHHLRYVGALLAIALLLGAPAASAQVQSNAAARLVSAMRIDDVTLLGLRLGLQRGIRDGKTSPKTLDCVSKLDRSTFAPVFAQAIAANMSAQEIASATAFFESAPGRKYIDSGIYQLYDAVGFSSPDPEPSVSEADMQAVTAFSRTSAGDKLLVRRIFDSPEIRGAIGARIQQVLNGCSQ